MKLYTWSRVSLASLMPKLYTQEVIKLSDYNKVLTKSVKVLYTVRYIEKFSLVHVVILEGVEIPGTYIK